jgi:GNAT superfamily N-acetyltransferase
MNDARPSPFKSSRARTDDGLAATRKPIIGLNDVERLPPGYPLELVGELRLDDGRRAQVRPILPQDAEPLRRAIADADADTLRLRFLGSEPVLDDATLAHLVVVDYLWRLALVATDDNAHGVAIGRYEGASGRTTAEIAIVVAPGWRRAGLATRLLALLALAAAARGLDGLTASYLAENRDVAGLVDTSGLGHHTSISAGVAEVDIEIGVLRADSREPFAFAEHFAASRKRHTSRA